MGRGSVSAPRVAFCATPPGWREPEAGALRAAARSWLDAFAGPTWRGAALPPGAGRFLLLLRSPSGRMPTFSDSPSEMLERLASLYRSCSALDLVVDFGAEASDHGRPTVTRIAPLVRLPYRVLPPCAHAPDELMQRATDIVEANRGTELPSTPEGASSRLLLGIRSVGHAPAFQRVGWGEARARIARLLRDTSSFAGLWDLTRPGAQMDLRLGASALIDGSRTVGLGE